MSTIKVTNINDTSNNASIVTGNNAFTVNGTVITGVSAGSTTITGEGGTNTTNLQQGLIKQWSRCQDAAMTVKDSFNTSSVTDSATGKGAPQFTTAMSNANYCNVCGGDDKQDGGGVMVCTIDDAVNQATSGYGLVNKKQTASAVSIVDLNQNFSSTVFGDLA